MIVLVAITISFALLVSILCVAIFLGDRVIAAQLKHDLEEAMHAIAIAQRVHQRRKMHH